MYQAQHLLCIDYSHKFNSISLHSQIGNEGKHIYFLAVFFLLTSFILCFKIRQTSTQKHPTSVAKVTLPAFPSVTKTVNSTSLSDTLTSFIHTTNSD